MKRKLIARNKQFLTSTMGKYVGNRSWRRITGFKFKTIDELFTSLQNPDKIQWKYVWLISNKAIDAHLKDLEDNYEEISLDDY